MDKRDKEINKSRYYKINCEDRNTIMRIRRMDILDKGWQQKYDDWKRNAREEFKNSEYYEESIRDDFEIREDGSVYLGDMCIIKNAVTPFKD